MIRFALVTDVHICDRETPYEGVVRKLSHRALPLLRDFVAFCNDQDLTFAAQLGDFIEDIPGSVESDRTHFKRGMQVLSGLRAPLLSVIGNHEQVNLSVDEICSLAGLETPFYRRTFRDSARDSDKEDCVLDVLVLFSASSEHTDIHISTEQMQWLEAELRHCSDYTIVLVHHPLDEQSLVGNVWFEKYPHYCFVEERVALRKILKESGKVKAVFGGHVHQTSVSRIDGIYYVTIQSLVERTKYDAASSAWALLELQEGQLVMRLYGAESNEFVLSNSL